MALRPLTESAVLSPCPNSAQVRAERAALGTGGYKDRIVSCRSRVADGVLAWPSYPIDFASGPRRSLNVLTAKGSCSKLVLRAAPIVKVAALMMNCRLRSTRTLLATVPESTPIAKPFQGLCIDKTRLPRSPASFC